MSSRWLREPFIQFLGLGLIVFLGMSLLKDDAGLDRNIHVSQADIARLAGLWQAQYEREPTEQELASIVEGFVREEVLVREAMALGLDDDDLIVRRRLAQKLEFLLDGRADVEEPGDEILLAWLQEHASRFQVSAQVSFKHAFFSSERSGTAGKEAASQSVAELQRDDADWRSVGDPFMMQREFAPRSQREIGDLFGPEFAVALFDLPEGEWTAPIRSAYGWHAAMVVQRLPETIPPFESIRDDVLMDYLEKRREEKKQAEFEVLKARYSIRVDQSP